MPLSRLSLVPTEPSRPINAANTACESSGSLAQAITMCATLGRLRFSLQTTTVTLPFPRRREYAVGHPVVVLATYHGSKEVLNTADNGKRFASWKAPHKGLPKRRLHPQEVYQIGSEVDFIDGSVIDGAPSRVGALRVEHPEV